MTFLSYFNQKVQPIKLIDKRKSLLMKFCNFWLAIGNFLHITNIKDNPHTETDESFMGCYGTTIGHGIYYSPAWPWDMKPSPFLVHELCHTVQFSILMSLRYIFSTSWRMFYESEAVQCEVLCFPGRRDESWFERRVQQFIKYGIKESIVRRELTKRLEEVKRAEPRASAARVTDAYAFWMNAHES